MHTIPKGKNPFSPAILEAYDKADAIAIEKVHKTSLSEEEFWEANKIESKIFTNLEEELNTQTISEQVGSELYALIEEKFSTNRNYNLDELKTKKGQFKSD